MNSFSRNLSMLIGGVVSVGVLAIGFAMLVQYKPWGVPDVLRAEYDVKVAAIHHRNQLLTDLADKPKPVLAVRTSQHVGLLDPLIKAERAFEIRNDGELPLTVEIQKSGNGVDGRLDTDTIAPGESTTATLCWQTSDQAGEFELVTKLVSNDPLKEEVELRLVGEVKSELVLPKSISFEESDITQQAGATFVVYSQVSDDLEILDVSCDHERFDWNIEPTTINDPDLAVKSAWLVRVWTTNLEYGRYNGTINVHVKLDADQDTVTRELSYKGKVRSPINFYSPEIHKSDGLDIGTIVAGEERQFHLLVRLRGDLDREIKVLDIEPSELQGSLKPLATKGDYRLTVTVPADCPMAVFNIPQKHGYVEVGDPHDRRFRNWFPLKGAVVALQPSFKSHPQSPSN